MDSLLTEINNLIELSLFTEKSSLIIQKHYDGEINFSPYSTDSNVPLSKGILANTIGTVRGASAHTREEWIEKESMTAGLGIVLDLMKLYFI